ncbi:hypothetical protein LX32DRAFT_651349 [Colletotrichum zoysiae]|uniref:Uncharacterized protein n=1 Tax=Colletotrichum zoysiae TaxID=1216348 RepID=A0AAD9M1J3_9PEZI|nr:hypothetical protein LX32DRAFT_651349 [Colletotrichum zoysiae]
MNESAGERGSSVAAQRGGSILRSWSARRDFDESINIARVSNQTKSPQYIYTSLRFNRTNEPRDNPDARVCVDQSMMDNIEARGHGKAWYGDSILKKLSGRERHNGTGQEKVGNDQGMRPDNKIGKWAVRPKSTEPVPDQGPVAVRCSNVLRVHGLSASQEAPQHDRHGWLESLDPEGREKEMGGRALHSPLRPDDYDPPSTSPGKQLPAVQTDYVAVKHASYLPTQVGNSGSPSLRVSPLIDHSMSERRFTKFRP